MNWKDYFTTIEEYWNAMNNNLCYKCKNKKANYETKQDFCKKCRRTKKHNEQVHKINDIMSKKTKEKNKTTKDFREAMKRLNK